MNESSKTILALIVLGVLIFPIISLDYVFDNSETYIIGHAFTNYNYENLDFVDFDKDIIENQLNPSIGHMIDEATNSNVMGWEVDDPNGGAPPPPHWDVEYQDDITYLGNDSYYIDTSGFTYTESVMLNLNITAHNLTNYDTVLIESNFECVIVYFDTEGTDNMNDLDSILTDNDTYLIINSLDSKLDLLNSVDYNVMVLFDSVDDNITFKIQYGVENEIADQDYTISDLTQYYIILTSSIAISIFVIVFVTDLIDIKFDRKNQNRK